MIKYSTISLPKELYDKLQELVDKHPELGYGSVADFCKEAIRLHVEEIKRELREDFLRRLDVPRIMKNLERLSAIGEDIYATAFERMRAMAFIFTKDFKVKECNYEFYSHLGYGDKEEVIGKDLYDFFEGKIKHTLRQTGNLRDYETRAIRKDGKKLDVMLSVQKINERTFVGVAFDVTVKNYLIEKERKLRQLYEYLIDEIADTVIVTQEGKIKFINKTSSITGYTAEELLGKHFIDFVAEEDKEKIMKNYEKLLKGKLKPEPRRYKLVFKDGSVKEIEMISKKIEYEGRPAVLTILRLYRR